MKENKEDEVVERMARVIRSTRLTLTICLVM